MFSYDRKEQKKWSPGDNFHPANFQNIPPSTEFEEKRGEEDGERQGEKGGRKVAGQATKSCLAGPAGQA